MCLPKRALHPPRSFLWEVLAEAQPQALRLPVLGSSLRIKNHKVSLTLENISLALIKYNHFRRKANHAPLVGAPALLARSLHGHFMQEPVGKENSFFPVSSLGRGRSSHGNGRYLIMREMGFCSLCSCSGGSSTPGCGSSGMR